MWNRGVGMRNLQFIIAIASCIAVLGLIDAQIKQQNQAATPQVFPEEVLPRGDAL